MNGGGVTTKSCLIIYGLSIDWLNVGAWSNVNHVLNILDSRRMNWMEKVSKMPET